MCQPLTLASPVHIFSFCNVLAVKVAAVSASDLVLKCVCTGAGIDIVTELQGLIVSDLSVNRVKINGACFLDDDLGDHSFEVFCIKSGLFKEITEDAFYLRIGIIHAVTGLLTAGLAPAPPDEMLIFRLADRSAISPSADAAENHAVK